MRQRFCLLLLLGAAGAVLHAGVTHGSYYESHSDCGYAADGFVNFGQSPELQAEPSLGVCGWGFGPRLPAVQGRVGECVACTFVAAERARCPRNSVLVAEPAWQLAQEDRCDWQGCWGGAQCVNGTAIETAPCAGGGINARCCPYRRYVRCCRALPCTDRRQPAGKCVAQEKDLLPGQQSAARVFVVPASSSDCFPYTLDTTRVCLADRTFAPGKYYDTCDVRPVSRDVNGCPKLPGYVFHAGSLLANAGEALLDDGTQWGSASGGSAAVQAAARDPLLMAALCDLDAGCAAFQADGGARPGLRYYLPSADRWVAAEAASAAAMAAAGGSGGGSADPCLGIYAKASPQAECPRIPGYLFTPQHTVDLRDAAGAGALSATAADGACGNGCSNSTALAVACDLQPGCVGFTSMHGLLLGSASGLAAQPLARFTDTPCMGLYTRAAASYPQEVLDLDALLCGDAVYCPARMQYSWSRRSAASAYASFIDVTLTLLTPLSLPARLLDVDLAASLPGGVKQLPNLRTLTVECAGAGTLVGGSAGGLPAAFALAFPFLEELRISGCGVTGSLPEHWSWLKYLRVLDLSGNRLSGPLPPRWSNMSLGYLNLSANALSGLLPESWRGIVQRQRHSPPPPGPAPPGPPPPRQPHAAAGGPAGWLVADLSGNALSGPLHRSYVKASCLASEVDMQLQASSGSGSGLAQLGARPTFLLQGNPGVVAWAGNYRLAASKGRYSSYDHSYNMCGAYTYLFAISILWGVFGFCLLSFIAWAAWRAAASWLAGRSRGGRPHRGSATNSCCTGGSDSAELDRAAAALDGRPGDAAGAGSAPCSSTSISRISAWAVRAWSHRWLRRLTLLLRVGFLIADVALDIRVAVWLYVDGDSAAAAACTAFIVAAQGVVAVAVFASLAPNLFGGWLATAAFAPLMVVAMPVVGPILAVANVRNPDVPLVFWRYLELVEFSVALLQAPAEAVAQTVIYARQNRMAGGMYLDHPLFLASIVLSLADCLIAAYKLLRYKRGPFWRVAIAFTHLDKARDPLVYRTPSHKPLLAFGHDTSQLEQALNPGFSGAPDSTPGSTSSGSRHQSFTNPLHRESGEGQQRPPQHGQDGAGADGPDSRASAPPLASAPTAHTYTPLTAPRYRPSLLAQSSTRLSVPYPPSYTSTHHHGVGAGPGPGSSRLGPAAAFSGSPAGRRGAPGPAGGTAAHAGHPPPPMWDQGGGGGGSLQRPSPAAAGEALQWWDGGTAAAGGSALAAPQPHTPPERPGGGRGGAAGAEAAAAAAMRAALAAVQAGAALASASEHDEAGLARSSRSLPAPTNSTVATGDGAEAADKPQACLSLASSISYHPVAHGAAQASGGRAASSSSCQRGTHQLRGDRGVGAAAAAAAAAQMAAAAASKGSWPPLQPPPPHPPKPWGPPPLPSLRGAGPGAGAAAEGAGSAPTTRRGSLQVSTSTGTSFASAASFFSTTGQCAPPSGPAAAAAAAGAAMWAAPGPGSPLAAALPQSPQAQPYARVGAATRQTSGNASPRRHTALSIEVPTDLAVAAAACAPAYEVAGHGADRDPGGSGTQVETWPGQAAAHAAHPPAAVAVPAPSSGGEGARSQQQAGLTTSGLREATAVAGQGDASQPAGEPLQ